MSEKILDRIVKLLAIQEGRGATEAEATLAQEHVQKLLQEHNLTLSQVEQHAEAGVPVAARIKEEAKLSASQQWRIDLMNGIAENNFCLARLHRTLVGKVRRKSYIIIGREVNVVASKLSYEYLAAALMREMREAGYHLIDGPGKWNKDGTYFMEGAAERIVARLAQKRRMQEVESRQAAEARSQSNGSHRELVLSDVYGSEAELNNDLLNGFAPGTTAAKRRAQEERRMAQQAEEERLVAAGVDKIEAFYRSHGYGEEIAKSYAENWRRASSRRGGGRNSSTGWSRGERAMHQKRNSGAFKTGSAAGARVSLDAQVGGSSKLSLPKK